MSKIDSAPRHLKETHCFLCKGLSTREVADRLGIAIATFQVVGCLRLPEKNERGNLALPHQFREVIREKLKRDEAFDLANTLNRLNDLPLQTKPNLGLPAHSMKTKHQLSPREMLTLRRTSQALNPDRPLLEPTKLGFHRGAGNARNRRRNFRRWLLGLNGLTRRAFLGHL